jgi:5-formyltetrahydrofolate cyclo-ligase
MAFTSKEESRAAFIKARDSLSQDEIRDKSRKIKDHFLALEIYQKANNVLFYYSTGSEVDTQDLIREALNSGKIVALPMSLEGGLLEVRSIKDIESDCLKGRFGILEPKVEKTVKIPIQDIEVFAIPGIAFDLQGNRIGRGKGYFDRYLAGLKTFQTKIGLAFEVQLSQSLPIDKHDIKVDILVTEERVLDFKK